MSTDMNSGDQVPRHQGPYLHAVRLDDGRYRVQFLKHGAVPRTSYTPQAGAVVKQAQRAGNIPIHTDDADLQAMCRSQHVELI